MIGELAGWAIQIFPNKHNRVFCFQPLKTHQGVLFSAPAGAQTDGAKIIIVSHGVQNIDIAPPSTGSREASATPTDSEPGVIKPGGAHDHDSSERVFDDDAGNYPLPEEAPLITSVRGAT